MMGLAPYGKPTYVEALRKMIRPAPGGKYELDTSYFVHASDGIDMSWREGSPHLGRVWSDRMIELLGPARDPEDPDFYGKWADIAASSQVVFEEIYFHVLNDLWERTKLPRLCLAGGCALNSVANGKIFERTPFKEVFVQPASGDDGTAIGAAFWVEHAVLKRPRRFVMEHAYTGPSYDDAAVKAAIDEARGGGLWDPAHRGGRTSTTRRSTHASRGPSPRETSWAGSRAGWSSGPGRWATAPSWPTRGAPT